MGAHVTPSKGFPSSEDNSALTIHVTTPKQSTVRTLAQRAYANQVVTPTTPDTPQSVIEYTSDEDAQGVELINMANDVISSAKVSEKIRTPSKTTPVGGIEKGIVAFSAVLGGAAIEDEEKNEMSFERNATDKTSLP